MRNETAKASSFVECLLNMAVQGEESSYYKYTTEWLHSVDRGGLYHVSDATFLFFRAVEVQSVLFQRTLKRL